MGYCDAALVRPAKVGFGLSAKLCKVHYLRRADVGAKRSEGPHSAKVAQ